MNKMLKTVHIFSKGLQRLFFYVIIKLTNTYVIRGEK